LPCTRGPRPAHEGLTPPPLQDQGPALSSWPRPSTAISTFPVLWSEDLRIACAFPFRF
jgi:hypothetical protein